jgi:hypothetical protein
MAIGSTELSVLHIPMALQEMVLAAWLIARASPHRNCRLPDELQLQGPLGGTGRTAAAVTLLLAGSTRTLCALAARLPAEAAEHPGPHVTEAELLALSDEEPQRQLAGCEAVVCCLGHTISLQGVFEHRATGGAAVPIARRLPLRRLRCAWC